MLDSTLKIAKLHGNISIVRKRKKGIIKVVYLEG